MYVFVDVNTTSYMWSFVFIICYSSKKKYRLAKWNILCQPKEQGGFGIQNLDLQKQMSPMQMAFQCLQWGGIMTWSS